MSLRRKAPKNLRHFAIQTTGMKTNQLAPLFVETIPDIVDDGVLYVSMSLASVIHRCACGCGQEVVTPLSPTDWQLYFDGENVSLEPSIGNWGFPCRSHYWIRGGKVRWSGSMSDTDIESGRTRDQRKKMRFYGGKTANPGILSQVRSQDQTKAGAKGSRLRDVWGRFVKRGKSS
jgi:hypothetical protein